MTIAVPLIENRVAPRCTSATRLLLVTYPTGSGTVSSRVLDVHIETPEELIELAKVHHISTLVCGGITRESKLLLDLHRVAVIENVACSAAEVMKALENGILRPGFGLAIDVIGTTPQESNQCVPQPSARPGNEPPWLSRRSPKHSESDTRSLPSDPPTEQPRSNRLVIGEGTAGSLLCRRAPEACRLAELVRFSLEMGLTRVGIAFCPDLRHAAQAVTRTLQEFIDTVPAICAIRTPSGETVLRNGRPGGRDRLRPGGDPLEQARLLNAARTDINVALGLCVGAECVLSSTGDAPMTTLKVGDAALGDALLGASPSARRMRRWINHGRDRNPPPSAS